MTMDDDKMPFLPLNGDETQKYDHGRHDSSIGLSSSSSSTFFARLSVFITSGLGLVLLILWGLYHAIGFGTAVQGDVKHVVESFTLPHNYSGHFPNVTLNATLGFQKVFVLNLADREDKRDEMSLVSYMSDMDMEYIDGVTKAEIARQTIADYDKSNKDLTTAVLGCYRSHVKALRKIVEERIETALILEDDADWDVDFRDALARLQDPFARLRSSMKQDGVQRAPKPEAPWGDSRDWDQLYLGACLETPWTVNATERKEFNLVDGKKLDFAHPPYVVYDDTTAAPLQKTNDNAKRLFEAYNMPIDETDAVRRRVIQRSRDPICTVAYAVTRRGASRLLYELTRTFNSPVDLLMAWAAEDGRVESYTVYPPIVSQWRIANGGHRNSDINFGKRDGVRADVGWSDDVRDSIRGHMKARIRPNGTKEMW